MYHSEPRRFSNTVYEGDKCPECGNGTVQFHVENLRLVCDNCGAEWNDRGMRVPCQSATTGG